MVFSKYIPRYLHYIVVACCYWYLWYYCIVLYLLCTFYKIISALEVVHNNYKLIHFFVHYKGIVPGACNFSLSSFYICFIKFEVEHTKAAMHCKDCAKKKKHKDESLVVFSRNQSNT